MFVFSSVYYCISLVQLIGDFKGAREDTTPPLKLSCENVKQILEYVLVLFNQALKHFSLQGRKAKFYGHFMLGGLGCAPRKLILAYLRWILGHVGLI